MQTSSLSISTLTPSGLFLFLYFGRHDGRAVTKFGGQVQYRPDPRRNGEVEKHRHDGRAVHDTPAEEDEDLLDQGSPGFAQPRADHVDGCFSFGLRVVIEGDVGHLFGRVEYGVLGALGEHVLGQADVHGHQEGFVGGRSAEDDAEEEREAHEAHDDGGEEGPSGPTQALGDLCEREGWEGGRVGGWEGGRVGGWEGGGWGWGWSTC